MVKQAVAEGIDEQEFVQEVLQHQEDFLIKNCWHLQMAESHILKCVDEEFKAYLSRPSAKISGKLVMDGVNQAKLCGLSVEYIEHVFFEIGKAAGVDNTIMTEFDMGRLLQV